MTTQQDTHPSPEAIRQMVRDIRTVHDRHTQPSLLMSEETIHQQAPECGTTACFAGWYYVSQAQTAPKILPVGEILRSGVFGGKLQAKPGKGYWANRQGNPIGYRTGKKKVAQALGFRGGNDLKKWALKYSDLWGNDRGNFMFVHIDAYNPQPDGSSKMERLLTHWLGVADRIERRTAP